MVGSMSAEILVAISARIFQPIIFIVGKMFTVSTYLLRSLSDPRKMFHYL